MPTTYGNDIVYCLKSHCGVRGYCRQKWVLQVQIICKFSNERTCKRNKDVQGLSCGFEDTNKIIIVVKTLLCFIFLAFILKFFNYKITKYIIIAISLVLVSIHMLIIKHVSKTFLN